MMQCERGKKLEIWLQHHFHPMMTLYTSDGSLVIDWKRFVMSGVEELMMTQGEFFPLLAHCFCRSLLYSFGSGLLAM